MEQFSLEKYLENPSRKVVTRDGRPVRIVCWDAQMECPIIALVSNKYNNKEIALHYHGDGTYSELMQGVVDLFFADEENELTEFQNKLFSVISEVWQDYMLGREVDITETVKEYSGELLDLAKKEIEEKDWRTPLRLYKNAYEQGKQDALKDLPKWKKDYFHNINSVFDGTLYYNGYYIDINELEKLPKEE